MTSPDRAERAKPRRRRLSTALVLGFGLMTTGGLWAAFAPTTSAAEGASPATIAAGKSMFEQSCASCHGLNGAGGPTAPSLIGVGAAAVDFQVSSGRMPLGQPGPQADRSQPKYAQGEIDAIAAYVDSLGGGPKVYDPNVADGELQRGAELFRTNCAQCHNFAGAGGALTKGRYAPNITVATDRQVAGAIRTGPESMPVFGKAQLSDHDVNSIVRYVTYLRAPHDPGGSALGHLGPVPEGLVIALVGLGGLIGATLWIGTRS